MDLFEAIEQRHSYRGAFLNQPVPRGDLQKIVEAGIAAPSGKNAQATQFIIVDDPAILDTIGRMHSMTAVHTMKALIVCVVDNRAESADDNADALAEDCAAAVENMLLAVTALGYASVWIDAWLWVQGTFQMIGKMLKVPEGKTVRVILPIGVPAEMAAQYPRKSFEHRAWFNAYGVAK